MKKSDLYFIGSDSKVNDALLRLLTAITSVIAKAGSKVDTATYTASFIGEIEEEE